MRCAAEATHEAARVLVASASPLARRRSHSQAARRMTIPGIPRR